MRVEMRLRTLAQRGIFSELQRLAVGESHRFAVRSGRLQSHAKPQPQLRIIGMCSKQRTVGTDRGARIARAQQADRLQACAFVIQRSCVGRKDRQRMSWITQRKCDSGIPFRKCE